MREPSTRLSVRRLLVIVVAKWGGSSDVMMMKVVVLVVVVILYILYVSDIVLHCLGMDFELHSTVLKRSPVLSALLEEAMLEQPTETTYYKSQVNKALDSLVGSAGMFISAVYLIRL